MSTLPVRPGAVRSLRRVLSHDGFFLVCAIDHLEDFDALLGAPSVDRDVRVMREKARLAGAASAVASAVLLDPVAGIPSAVLADALAEGVGVIASIEDEDYGHPAHPRESVLREGWDASKAKAAGADMVKLLWFYRPDLVPEVAAAQRDLLAAVCRDAVTAGLTSVIEPIWHAVEGEDVHDLEWRARRDDGIVASALEAARLGADVLKVEFPGSVSTPAERTAASDRCARLSAELEVPWVLLSAGVSLADFETQLQIACAGGASGYMAGRSVWRDAVGDPSRDAEVVARLRSLNAIVRSYARPAMPEVSLDDAVALPRDWYVDSIG
ncbi:hypothetical protein [Microbacterium allomyrinae]|jgi:tagatose 1,6-diphosphate aldolase|uniref:Tagatose 1,6-diphosphate aldolase n=1 Tax=Microbacterium allomyrinae TaxID=2830666 RepID=A0A9X1LVU7_9MICO|nr:hypothetical protein [Microbacterium allomyrinae]MCC2032603.1 hypothetical protein [Microbacterium allomyrinae]